MASLILGANRVQFQSATPFLKCRTVSMHKGATILKRAWYHSDRSIIPQWSRAAVYAKPGPPADVLR